MDFGNWLVSDHEISWNGGGLHRFVIPAASLTTIERHNGGSGPYYMWILQATGEDWLTQDDLYDLNYAFVYAAARWDADFSYLIFDETLAEQYDRFDEEDEDVDFEF